MRATMSDNSRYVSRPDLVSAGSQSASGRPQQPTSMKTMFELVCFSSFYRLSVHQSKDGGAASSHPSSGGLQSRCFAGPKVQRGSGQCDRALGTAPGAAGGSGLPGAARAGDEPGGSVEGLHAEAGWVMATGSTNN